MSSTKTEKKEPQRAEKTRSSKVKAIDDDREGKKGHEADEGQVGAG